MSHEAVEVKQGIKDKDMSDGAPLVRIWHSLARLRQEVVHMDDRISMVHQHDLR